MPRTALIVAVPEAEPAVGALRLAHDWSARARCARARDDPLSRSPTVPRSTSEQSPSLVASFAAFDFELDSRRTVRRRARLAAPTSPERFVALTEAVWRRLPDYPPYEGAHDDGRAAPDRERGADRRRDRAADPRDGERGDADRRSGGRTLVRPPRVPALPYGSMKSIAGVLSSVIEERLRCPASRPSCSRTRTPSRRRTGRPSPPAARAAARRRPPR